MEPIDLALAELASLKAGEKLNYTAVAKKYSANRTTLSKRHRGLQQSRDIQYENQSLLNHQQEKTLVQYIDKLTERGLPPSKQMIRNFAAEISGKEPGKMWVSRFIKRHNLELVSKWTTGLDNKRLKADSAFKCTLYFELLR